MKKGFGIFIGAMVLLVMTMTAVFAQALPADPNAAVDWATLIGQLIANPKAMTAAFIGALVVLVIVQAMKSEALGKIFKFIPDQAQLLVITVLGQLYAVLLHALVLKDQQISVALVGVLSSGGAAAIFNGLKLAFPKFFGQKAAAQA